VTEFERVSAGALRSVREGKAAGLPRAVAFFGASFTARVAADMLFKALGALSSKFVRVRFFDDQAQCFAWIDEMRPMVIEHAWKMKLGKTP
jgi:hypothetical protein